MFAEKLKMLKHFHGWRCSERLIIFNVDDYGTIRTQSPLALEALRATIPGFGTIMDERDALETREDLEALFDVLRRHSGADGRPAVFTAYALSANPDLTWMRQQRSYRYEWLPQTFERLAAEQPIAYEGAWRLWGEGMREGLIQPQFHGREHINVPLLEAKLVRGDQDLAINLEHGCMAGLQSIDAMPGVGFTQSFNLHDPSMLDRHRDILAEGIDGFESVYGFRSRTFTPPAQKLHASLDDFVHAKGIEAIDKPFFGRQPTGKGPGRWRLNFLQRPREGRVGTLVRNVVFEPTGTTVSDPVGQALRQIESAFQWKKPAIVSSHRVNYSGHIDPNHRRRGLQQLDALLTGITERWPDARFITADELVDLMKTDA